MRKILSFFAAILFAAGMMATDYELVYTLDGSITTGGNSNYAQDGGGLTQDGLEWSVTGNTTINPWRIGGKNLDDVDRELYTKGSISENIAKIEVEHGTKTLSAINSMKIEVASDAAFVNIVSTLTPTYAPSSTVTVLRPEATSWEDCYYRITYNVDAGGSNSYLQLISVKFYKDIAEGGEGGGEEPTTQDLYLKLSSDWAGWPAKYAVYYFNDTENGWSEFMTEVDGEDNTYTTTIPVGYSKVIFVRLDGEATEANWDNKWSQTGNEDIPEGKNHFTVTSGGTGSECGGVWAKYPVVPTYYVKGTFNNWGDGMEMTEGTYTFENLAADTYEIKVVDDANNWYGFEVLDQTKSSANIYNAGGNIKFTLAEAGNVTVAYANSKITVTGTFVAPSTKFTVTVPENTEKAYIAGNFNNWTPTEMTLKAGEEDVFELTVEGVESDTVAYKYLAGADWKFEEVIEDNRSYNAADEVSAWKAVPTIYKYAKVKEAPVNWTGHYIIAWADHKPHSAIKVGSSSKDDFVAADDALVFTDGDTISIMEGLDFAVNIRFGASEGAYTLQLPDGKYIYLPNANGVCSKDEATDMYLAVSPSTTQTGIQIGDKADMSNRVIYNNNTNYRSYTNKYEATGYNLPTLYRLVNEPFDCLDGPYGVLINGKDVVVAEALAGEEEYDAAGRKQYRAYLNLEKEDIIQIVNTSCGSAWLPAIEESGMSAHFDADDEMAVIDTTGCFDLYIKMKSGDDKIYIGAGICADDTIRYTVRGKGGILGEDFENAIDSKQDTLELALEAGKYELKVIVGADWKGFEQLTDTATGLKVGDQGNICFELNEAGAVSIVYNDSVFKLIGNFYIAPIKYYIAGSMSKWEEEMVELLPLEEKADSLGIAINLEADSLYAFKVVRVQGTDTAWYGLGEAATMEYGNSEGWWVYKSEGDNNQANVGLMTTKAAEYPFVVKVADGHMEVSVVIPEPEAKLPVVGFGANFNDWNWPENLFVPAEDSLSASFKITLGITDTIEFKIVSDGKWLSLYGENGKYLIHRDWNHADHVNETGEVPNFAFNADAEGEYIFTWTYADSTLVVTFPEKETRLEDGYYLIGLSMADWKVEYITEDYLFTVNPSDANEYMLNVTLAAEQQFKVVRVLGDAIVNWYPDGENNNFVVDANHAGNKTVYFRPNGDGGEGWHYNVIYVAANDATAIDETVAAGKAAKVLRDGQILIIKGEKIFNVQGQRVK